MKPRHLSWLVTAAALSAALSATAQQPSGTGTDSGTRTDSTQRPGDATGRDRDLREPGAGDPATSAPGESGDRTRTETMPGMEDRREEPIPQQPQATPKRKRSFWDRLTGRHKEWDQEIEEQNRPYGGETRPQQP